MLKLNEISLRIDYDKSGYPLSDWFYPFGGFLCMVGNLDVISLKSCLETIIQEFVEDNRNKELLYVSYQKLVTLQDKLFQTLDELTHNIILSFVISNELITKIKTLTYISDVNTILFPNYIYLEELQNICIKLIEKKYDDLDNDDYSLLSGDSIKLLIKYNDFNVPEIKYCIGQIGDLVAFDASNYCKSSILIKKCENCGKYFIPASRSDEIYCNNVYNPESGKTCKDIGYEVKLSKDAFKSAYRTAYKTQRARIKYNSHIQNYEEKHFKPWDNAAKEALSKFEALNDIEGYKEWLVQNRKNF